MGEMIKFGIKIGLVIASAVGLMAALTILVTLTSDYLNVLSNANVLSVVREFTSLVGLFVPIPAKLIITLVASLGIFKVAYWAADKMIWLIDALG